MEIGQTLAEAREKRGLTLADISHTTKIPVHVLGAIEHNDVAHLPQGFFIRAFVRAYANEVGVNADELLEQAHPGEVEEIAVDAPATSVRIEEPSSSKSLFFAVALAGACTLYYSGFASQVTTPSASPVVVVAPVDRPEPVAAAPPPCVPAAPPAAPIQSVRRVVAPVPASKIEAPAPVETGAPAVDASPAVSDAALPAPDPAPSPAPIEQF